MSTNAKQKPKGAPSPGTWYVNTTDTSGCNNSAHYGAQVDTEYGTIAHGIGWRADAHLIAAAPAMLDVLRELETWLDGIADNAEDASKTQRDACALLDVVRGTIERAEGRAV